MSDSSQSPRSRSWLRIAEEPVRKILTHVGLTEKEIDLYIFIAKRGELKGTEVAKQTRIDKAEVYRILKRLQRKGLLQLTMQAPARFATVPFEKVIDSLVKARKDEATLIENSKEDLLNDWAKISRPEGKLEAEKFVVLEDYGKIYPKMLELIKTTKTQLSAILSPRDLTRAAQFGLIDTLARFSSDSKAKFSLLTEVSDKNVAFIHVLIEKLLQIAQNFEARVPELGLPLSPRIIVRDNQELLLFVTPKTQSSKKESVETCLWTNCQALVESFNSVFLNIWSKSTNLEGKIRAVETGKPVATITVFDSLEANRKYHEILRSAQEEVVMMTSWEAVTEICHDPSTFKSLSEKNVSIKLLAPIIDRDLVASLLEFCEIRHCAPTNSATTLIDGQHLFQFKNQPLTVARQETTPFPETIMYTNQVEYVQKTRAAMNELWSKACNLTPKATLVAVKAPEGCSSCLWDAPSMGQSIYRKWLLHVIEREEGTIKEADVINKMIYAKRLPAKDPEKDVNIQYGSTANAVIHPPSYFNLPDLIITAHHENKESTFGAEDWLSISLWLESPKGFAYVPVAHITDNPKAAEWRKGVYRGTPAGDNSILVLKNQIKVTVQGNTIFAGWTVPIPLLMPKFILPPACILFEGYGEIHPNVLKSSLPSGRTQISERNSFKAFVTFFHPASTYQGPGTDGWLHRERVMTANPPESSKH